MNTRMLPVITIKNQVTCRSFGIRCIHGDAVENTFDILNNQRKRPFIWRRIPDCYQFFSFLFDVLPLIYRLVSTTLFPFWNVCLVV
jgi:hypothetical protein